MTESGSRSDRRIAAFFDVDGTLGSTNIVLTYIAFRNDGASRLERWLRIASVVPKIPYYKLLDRLSRNLFCSVFYRKYAGVERAELEAWAERDVARYWNDRLYPAALRKLEEHRERGHRIGIVSGSLEPVLEPLADALGADILLATEAETEGTRLTGRLPGGPLNGENKAIALRRLSDSTGIDLEQCYAYGDSYADKEFLESVGNPVAVNPDRRLNKIATSRGWPIQHWAD